MSIYTEYSGKDRYFYPVVITKNNNQFVFDEGSGNITGSVDPGVYWMHLDTDVDNFFPSLPIAIKDELINQGSQNYTIDELDLSSGDLRYSAIKYEGGNSSWDLKLDDSNFTMSPGYFGFNRFASGNKGTPAGFTYLDAETSVLGQWISPKAAAYKTRAKISKNGFRSDQSPNAVQNSWTPRKDTRSIKYHKIDGAHVFRYRALDSSDASDAGLPVNDTNNAFEDLLEGMHIGRVLVKYELSDQSDAMQFNTNTPSVSEVWQIPENGQPLDAITENGRTWEDEHYDLEWDAQIVPEDIDRSTKSLPDGYLH